MLLAFCISVVAIIIFNHLPHCHHHRHCHHRHHHYHYLDNNIKHSFGQHSECAGVLGVAVHNITLIITLITTLIKKITFRCSGCGRAHLARGVGGVQLRALLLWDRPQLLILKGHHPHSRGKIGCSLVTLLFWETCCCNFLFWNNYIWKFYKLAQMLTLTEPAVAWRSLAFKFPQVSKVESLIVFNTCWMWC